jgi:hypothetical protein
VFLLNKGLPNGLLSTVIRLANLSARCRELRRKHDELHALLRINLTVLATAHAVSEGIIRGVAELVTYLENV